MKNKTHLIFLIRTSQICLFYLLLMANTWAQDLELDWAFSIGTDATGRAIAVDSQGYIYTAGTYSGLTDFDPGPGVYNLPVTGSDKDLFVQKLDKNGNFIWAKSIGGADKVFPSAIAVDAFGQIHITGLFEGTIDFDPGPGTFFLTESGSVSAIGPYDVFVLKLSAAGDFKWAVRMGNTGQESVGELVVDDHGSVYLVGGFKGTVDFDPGTAVYNLSTGNGYSDGFIQKLDSLGHFVWAKQIGGSSSDDLLGLAQDESGDLYLTGRFRDTVDFDPGPGVYDMVSVAMNDAFFLKLDAAGNFIWAKQISSISLGIPYFWRMEVDNLGGLYAVGNFLGTVDFDPGPASFPVTAVGQADIVIQKLDTAGNFLWNKSMGSVDTDYGYDIALDHLGNVYTTGSFNNDINLDPSGGAGMTINQGSVDIYIQKLNPAGQLVWAYPFGSAGTDIGKAIAVDQEGSVYISGDFQNTIDFDATADTFNLTAGFFGMFLCKYGAKGIIGSVYNDFDQNCIQNVSETNLAGRVVEIQPIGIYATTDSRGYWRLDSLPAGNYTAKIDTSNGWFSNCSTIHPFTVVHPDSVVWVTPFAILSPNPCPAASVSLHAPFLRPGFSNQKVYVQACNEYTGTSIMNNVEVIVELDTLLTVQSGAFPYVSLGNNRYRINLGGPLYPGQCTGFYLNCQLSMNAVLGQAVCMNATINPVDSCALDSIANPFPSGINPCHTAYDFSHLVIRPTCINDTISFEITNTGDGDMSCYAQVRLYIDGQYVWMDSIMLNSGEIAVFAFPGDGRTWHMEVDQHPLHPGNSQPSASIELCGNGGNWTPNLFNLLGHNDADPIVDIFCGTVTGSFDPNDKSAEPIGIDSAHYIKANQAIEYLVRFQNTGTDTAFTVVVRDTLAAELDIYSVRPAVSSHAYDFRIYGPRVLEWTFNNIMLPDSNVNEVESHGFLKYFVDQTANLPEGTSIENSAAIYFDFNSPIITNTYFHTIDSLLPTFANPQDTIVASTCDSFLFNGMTYSTSGMYWHPYTNNGMDSLYIINLTNNSSSYNLVTSSCDSFVLNNQTYYSNGMYTQVLSNSLGCDSTIYLDLNLNIGTIDSSTIVETACNSYTAADGQTFFNSGVYTVVIPNAAGCDSTININLTIDTLDNTLLQNGIVLTANATNLSYQWVDCANNNSPIAGATNQSFSPTTNGWYALVLTDGTCTDSSTCVEISTISVHQLEKEWGVNVFPNPAQSKLFVEKELVEEVHLTLKDNLGRTLLNKKAQDGLTVLDFGEVPAGIYYLIVSNDQEFFTKKIIVL